MEWHDGHSFSRIFAQCQLHAAGLINSCNLITFEQTVTDFLGTV